MTYSARCGVRTDACGLDACSCAPSATQPAIVAQEPVQRCEHCWHPVAEHYGRWCRYLTGAIKADGSQRICCCEGADSGGSSGGLRIENNPTQTTVCACPAYTGVGRMACDVCGHDSTEHEAHDGPCTHPTRKDC